MPDAVILPGGRNVSVAAEARDRLCCGILIVEPVEVDGGGSAAAAAAELGESLQEVFAERKPSGIPGLAEARTLYKSFGMDPTRHRPSSEALLRRVLQGKGLYHINNAVDTCNLVSLTFLLPIGMYDLSLVRGNVILRTGVAGEEYPGIRKGSVHLEGRLGLFDDQGAFGSPTSDSARTCVSEATTTILAVIMATGAYSAARMGDNVGVFGHLFGEHCRGRVVCSAVLGGAS